MTDTLYKSNKQKWPSDESPTIPEWIEMAQEMYILECDIVLKRVQYTRKSRYLI